MIDSTWVEILLELTLKAVLVLGFAFIILLIGKRFSFATRHLILTFAVISLLFLLPLSQFLPKWNLSLLPSVPQYKIQTQNEIQEAQSLAPASLAYNSLFPDFSFRPGASAHPNPIKWPVILFIGWLAGAFVVLMREAAGSIGTRLMIRQGSSVDNRSLIDSLAAHAKTLDIKRNIRLLQTAKALVPLTCGWLHPVIILPPEATGWSEKRKDIVLLHELAHIKRGDFFLSFLTRTASILYWFNPLLWIAIRRLAIEREHACDDCVLATGTKASEYAGHLLDIARKASSSRWFSPAGITIAKKSNLEVRIMSILDNKKPTGQIKLSTVLLTGLLALSLILPIASIHTWAQNEQSQEEQEKTEESTDIPDKEEIKRVLKEFFSYIENLDFSKALTFFADDPEIEITEGAPVVIVKSGKVIGTKNIQILTGKDLKKIQVKTNIKCIVKNDNAVKVDGEIAIIGTDKDDVKRILLKKDSGHTMVLNYKDGKWKLCADALKLNFVRDDVDKTSKKVALCLTEDGVTYTIIRVSPSVTVVKQEKK
jgi:beta-lactamase regulating signal transducer with metallopeptidase domain